MVSRPDSRDTGRGSSWFGNVRPNGARWSERPRRKRAIQGLVAFVVLVVALAPVAPGVAAATDADAGATTVEIGSCTTIDSPGTYVLTGDVEDSSADRCIVIRSDDVTLDGNGHVIDGVDGADTTGIALVPPDGEIGNVTITAVTVRDWETGVDVASQARGSQDVEIAGTRIVSNVGSGIAALGPEGLTMRNNVVENNAVGVVIHLISDSTIAGNVFRSNDGTGMALVGGSAGVVVSDNEFLSNGGDGLDATNGLSGLEIVDNTVSSNDGIGIDVGPVFGVTIAGNTITENGESGVSVIDAQADIVDNRIANNGRHGIQLEGVDGTVGDNSVTSNGQNGLDVRSSSGIGVDGNSFTDNGGDGIRIAFGGDTTFSDNTVTGNADWAYHSSGTYTVTDTTLDSAHVSFRGKDVALDGVTDPPDDPPDLTNIGQYVDATDTDSNAWLRIAVSYTEADLQEAGVDEDTLRMWRYDGSWTEVAGTNGVDTGRNVVFANVTEFGIIAPLGEPEAREVRATVDVDPDTLNTNARAKFVTAYVQLPEGIGVAAGGHDATRFESEVDGTLTDDQRQLLDDLRAQTRDNLASATIEITARDGTVEVETSGYVDAEQQRTIDALVARLEEGGTTATITVRKEVDWNEFETTVDLSTVELNGRVGAIDERYGFAKDPELKDRDGDGLPEVAVKFHHDSVTTVLESGAGVEVTVTGETDDGTSFRGTDTIRVVEDGNGNGNGGGRGKGR